MDTQAIQRQRNRLVRGALYAIVLMAIACGVSFIDSWTEAVAPNPDHYKILFQELAHEHYLATTTPTVVKEDARTLEFFESQYEIRNKNLGYPHTNVVAPESGLLSFSYLPGVMDLRAVPEEVLQQEAANPNISLAMPGLALWVYSKQQNLAAFFACVTVEPDLLKNPPPWLDLNNLQTIDWRKVVSVQGSLPDRKFTPLHADLIPLEDLRLENIDRHSEQDPDLHKFDYNLPLVYPPGVGGVRPYISGKDTIARLRFEAAVPFLATRWCFRLLVLPIGLLWLSRRVWRLRKLHKQYYSTLEAHVPFAREEVRVSFFHFLFGDLESRARDRIAEARTMQYLTLAKQQEEREKQELTHQLRDYRDQLELTAIQSERFDEVLLSGSTEKLRRLLAEYRPLIEQGREQSEKEKQKTRDRQREIQRLEIELEALPLDKRDNEAREAWSLYQQARVAEDPKRVLQLLHEARKKIPKHLRPERF